MTDEPAAGTSLAVSPPPRAVREYRPVESSSGIMDTARFEHLERVANIMALAGLMPDTLTRVDGKPDGPYLDFGVIKARAFLIANQADNWKADPNAVAQCASLVYGKLMYEGKLVHGLIETRLGIRLRYDFGTYNHGAKAVEVGKMPPAGDQTLGVLVSGKFDDEDAERSIIGSVGMWHKGPKSPWGAETAWLRQLRYMGAREWARAHSPGLILGIMTDDEIDEAYQHRPSDAAPAQRRVKADLKGRLAAPTDDNKDAPAPEGFDQAHVERETGGAAADQAGAVVEQEAATDGKAGEKKASPSPASSEGSAEPDKAGAAAAAAIDGDDLPDDLKGGAEPIAGPAPADVVYYLASVPTFNSGRRATFKNGEPFSEANDPAIAVYAEHAPKVAAAASNEKAKRDTPQEQTSSSPFDPIYDAMSKADSWLTIKAMMPALYGSDDFKALEATDQAAVRCRIWDEVLRIKKDCGDPIDFVVDSTAFRLWMDTQAGPEGADAIEGSYRILQKENGYLKMKETSQKSLDATVAAALANMRGG